MSIDYAKILKVDRMHQQAHPGMSLAAESEHDRSKLIFSPALHRLAQLYPGYPAAPGQMRNSKLSIALQAAQIGRNIASNVAIQLENNQQASRDACTALVNFVECACLISEIGNPPFGHSGEVAIRRWFADFGPAKIKAACRTQAQRELTASDARLVNALADFAGFERHPQSLRVLTKFHWGNSKLGLNLCKATLASHIRYLHITGNAADEHGHASDKPGFFSTEAGMMKSVWSSFGYDPLSQRFPLNYIVEAATDIASAFGELEQAVDSNLLEREQAVAAIRDAWLSSYIPADPDPADEQIMNLLSPAIEDTTQADTNVSELRRALINTICDYAARRFIEQQEVAFSGKLSKLLPAESGSGVLLTAMKSHLHQRIGNDPRVTQEELHGYATIHRLLDHFGTLLELPTDQFQLALEHADHGGNDFDVKTRLLALIPVICRNAYSQLVAQLGRGRDVEFEEWNARAHLVVDYIAGLTDESAAYILNVLNGD